MKALDALLKYDNIAPIQVFRTYGGDICVEYRDSYVEGCNASIITYGFGKTLEEACQVYIERIDGKTMGFYDPNGGIKTLAVNFSDYKDNKKEDTLRNFGNFFTIMGSAAKFFQQDKMTLEEALNILDPAIVNCPSVDRNVDTFKDVKARKIVVDYAREKMNGKALKDNKEETT